MHGAYKFFLFVCEYLRKYKYIVSWEPEGHYCCSKMFCWEPEGCYIATDFVQRLAPFWFSTKPALNIVNALLALNWRYSGHILYVSLHSFWKGPIVPNEKIIIWLSWHSNSFFLALSEVPCIQSQWYFWPKLLITYKRSH